MHSTIPLVEAILLDRLIKSRLADALLYQALSSCLYRLRLDAAMQPSVAVPDYLCTGVLDNDQLLLTAANRYVYYGTSGHVLRLIRRHIKKAGLTPGPYKFPPIKSKEFNTGMGFWGRYPLELGVREDNKMPTGTQIAFLRMNKLIY